MTRDQYNDLVMDRARRLLAEMQADVDALEDEGGFDEYDDDDYDMDLEDAVDLVAEAIRERAGSQEIDRLIDAVASIYSSHYAGATDPQIVLPQPPHPRDLYNARLLEEAEACQQVNAEDGEPDTDLDDQITLVVRLRDAGDLVGWDGAVTHLRQMLTISYVDDSDLPAVVQRAQVAQAPEAPREWVSGVVAHAYWYATRQPMTDEDSVRQTLALLFGVPVYDQPVTNVSGSRWHVSVPAEVFARWERTGGAPVSMQVTTVGAVEFDIVL